MSRRNAAEALAMAGDAGSDALVDRPGELQLCTKTCGFLQCGVIYSLQQVASDWSDCC